MYQGQTRFIVSVITYAIWKADFTVTAKMRGIGWAICYQNLMNGRLSNHWISLHEIGNIAGFVPLLVLGTDLDPIPQFKIFGRDLPVYVRATPPRAHERRHLRSFTTAASSSSTVVFSCGYVETPRCKIEWGW